MASPTNFKSVAMSRSAVNAALSDRSKVTLEVEGKQLRALVKTKSRGEQVLSGLRKNGFAIATVGAGLGVAVAKGLMFVGVIATASTGVGLVAIAVVAASAAVFVGIYAGLEGLCSSKQMDSHSFVIAKYADGINEGDQATINILNSHKECKFEINSKNEFTVVQSDGKFLLNCQYTMGPKEAIRGKVNVKLAAKMLSDKSHLEYRVAGKKVVAVVKSNGYFQNIGATTTRAFALGVRICLPLAIPFSIVGFVFSTTVGGLYKAATGQLNAAQYTFTVFNQSGPEIGKSLCDMLAKGEAKMQITDSGRFAVTIGKGAKASANNTFLISSKGKFPKGLKKAFSVVNDKIGNDKIGSGNVSRSAKWLIALELAKVANKSVGEQFKKVSDRHRDVDAMTAAEVNFIHQVSSAFDVLNTIPCRRKGLQQLSNLRLAAEIVGQWKQTSIGSVMRDSFANKSLVVTVPAEFVIAYTNHGFSSESGTKLSSSKRAEFGFDAVSTLAKSRMDANVEWLVGQVDNSAKSQNELEMALRNYSGRLLSGVDKEEAFEIFANHLSNAGLISLSASAVSGGITWDGTFSEVGDVIQGNGDGRLDHLEERDSASIAVEEHETALSMGDSDGASSRERAGSATSSGIWSSLSAALKEDKHEEASVGEGVDGARSSMSRSSVEGDMSIPTFVGPMEGEGASALGATSASNGLSAFTSVKPQNARQQMAKVTPRFERGVLGSVGARASAARSDGIADSVRPGASGSYIVGNTLPRRTDLQNSRVGSLTKEERVTYPRGTAVLQYNGQVYIYARADRTILAIREKQKERAEYRV